MIYGVERDLFVPGYPCQRKRARRASEIAGPSLLDVLHHLAELDELPSHPTPSFDHLLV